MQKSQYAGYVTRKGRNIAQEEILRVRNVTSEKFRCLKNLNFHSCEFLFSEINIKKKQLKK